MVLTRLSIADVGYLSEVDVHTQHSSSFQLVGHHKGVLLTKETEVLYWCKAHFSIDLDLRLKIKPVSIYP